MVRRLTILVAVLVMLAAPSAFSASNGCKNSDCLTLDEGVNFFCVDLGDNSGRTSGCTTIKQCMPGEGCIYYCQYTVCYLV